MRANHLALVLAYVQASQRARGSGDPSDFEAVRRYLADDVVVKQAAPRTNNPWRTVHIGADAMIARLRLRSSASLHLQTETVNATAAGDEVLVEQVSALTTTEYGESFGAVCFIFTVERGKISAVRFYRNDAQP